MTTNLAANAAPESSEIIDTMRHYGGSFVQALAAAFCAADSINFAKLRAAFPEYWEQYAEMASKKAEALSPDEERRAAMSPDEANLFIERLLELEFPARQFEMEEQHDEYRKHIEIRHFNLVNNWPKL